MYPLKFVSTIILFLCLCCYSYAQSIDVENYAQSLPKGTSVALLVQPVGASEPTVDYHGQRLALPASTEKIITALAALLQLGEDYRFTTTFETNGSVKNNQLNGDMIVRFSGDPTLKRQQLSAMVRELTRQGIKTINGKVIVNTAVFASHDRAPGWSWNNMTHCFSTAPSAAIIDGNCFYVSLSPAKELEQFGQVRVPAYYPITVTSQVKTISSKSGETKYCELDVIAKDRNHYVLSGCITQNSKPVPLVFAVQDGAAYVSDLLKSDLEKEKIIVKGGIEHRASFQDKGKTLLASQQSAPLRSLLTIMMKKSDNLIADTVFRTMGREYFGVAGTWRSASDAVREVLLKKANIDLANSVIMDGSGLSRQNLISASTMMQLLQYIAKNDKQLNMVSMFPTSGIDGTLLNRNSIKTVALKGQVSAKTGMLEGVYNLAGFMTTQEGKQVAFVQFLSGYSFSPKAGENKRTPLINFENKLYHQLYYDGQKPVAIAQ